jgi:TfoX/Sxy family transcriptional regulator of competence genes
LSVVKLEDRVAYDEELAKRVKGALGPGRRLEEKRMFGGLCFMVSGKMCVTVGKDRIMCRIDPAIHDDVLGRKGCRTVVMKGREYRGYLYVDAKAVRTKRELDYWVQLALDYNSKAKVSGKKQKR